MLLLRYCWVGMALSADWVRPCALTDATSRGAFQSSRDPAGSWIQTAIHRPFAEDRASAWSLQPRTWSERAPDDEHPCTTSGK